jgi:hypothetical protein
MTGNFVSLTAKTAYSEELSLGARHEDKEGHDSTASD